MTAPHPGAALALFADLDNDVRLGALLRRAETIGADVARQLLGEIASGAALDRFAADQIVPFAGLASGDSVFRVTTLTDHLRTAAWLASLFVGAAVDMSGIRVVIRGIGRMTDQQSTPARQ